MAGTFSIKADRTFLRHFYNRQRIGEISLEMAEILKQRSKDDDMLGAYAKFGYGRWLYVMVPEENAYSAFTDAVSLFKAAGEKGLVDAWAALAIMIKEGDGFDRADPDYAEKMIESARAQGSEYADILYFKWNSAGDDDIFEELKRKVKAMMNMQIDPEYFDVLANAFDDRGEYNKASTYFELSIEMGNIISYRNLALMYDARGDAARSEQTMEKGFAQGCFGCSDYGYDPEAYELAQGYVFKRAKEMIKLPDGAQPTKQMLQRFVSDQLQQRLKYASEHGNDLAAYLLGDMYLNGNFGMPVDKKLALHYFIRGMALGSEFASEAVADFFEENEDFRKVYDVDDAAIAHFRLISLRYGNDEIYPKVLEAYQKIEPFREKYAKEMEKVWIPLYDDDEEVEDDDSEFAKAAAGSHEADIVPQVLILGSNGHLTIKKADLGSYNSMRDMGELIDASGLDAVHFSQKLTELTKAASLHNNLVMYVDRDGYAKDLPDNAIATMIYGSGAEIRGDIIFALENQKYDSLSFTNGGEVRDVISALQQMFGNLITLDI